MYCLLNVSGTFLLLICMVIFIFYGILIKIGWYFLWLEFLKAFFSLQILVVSKFNVKWLFGFRNNWCKEGWNLEYMALNSICYFPSMARTHRDLRTIIYLWQSFQATVVGRLLSVHYKRALQAARRPYLFSKDKFYFARISLMSAICFFLW